MIDTQNGLDDFERIEPVAILVVEDVPEVSELLCEDLKDVGFCSETFQARSLKDATVILEENSNIQCVLIDLTLPDGSGLDLVKKLRASEFYHDKPIVMISGNDDVTDILDAVREGVNDYIVKPWNKGELKEKIGYVLVKHERVTV